MNIKEFQEASKRTAPFNANATNEQELNWFLSNYTFGLVGEYLELDQLLNENKYLFEPNKDKQKKFKEDLKKEFGDVWHYVTNLMNVLGEEYSDYKSYESNIDLKYQIGNFVENIKKSIYHGHGLNKEELINILYGIAGTLKYYCGSDLEEILSLNIDKLKKRYPDKFTTQASIDRVDTK